jgi:hypothetical protein
MQESRQAGGRDVSLYVSIRRDKHKHGPAWSYHRCLQSGAVTPNERLLRHFTHPQRGRSIEFQGVIDCLPRELATKSLKPSGLACTGRGHMCLA